MYHRERRKMKYLFIYAVLTLTHSAYSKHSGITTTDGSLSNDPVDYNFDNNIIDFEEDYSLKFNKKHGTPWHSNDIYHKQSHRYTIINEDKANNDVESKVSVENSSAVVINNDTEEIKIVEDTTPVSDLGSIPIELISTTENVLVSIIDSTTEPDLTVIPLSTTKKTVPEVEISETVTLPSSTQSSESFTDSFAVTTENLDSITVAASSKESTTAKREVTSANTEREIETITFATTTDITGNDTTTAKAKPETTTLETNTESKAHTKNITTLQTEVLKTNSSKIETIRATDSSSEVDVPVFTELDAEDKEVPEDYYDSKDVIPTTAPKTDALSVIFGLAGSVVESVVGSVAERVVPKGIVDLFRRMQRQSEALEAERLRSREENGGLGQFGRGILKSISSGLSRPLSQLMAGVRDFGSLDTDRGFISSLATGVSSVANVANSVVDSFKDRVQAIYPGTVWCGDGHSPQARSSDLGLFFFTDTCCRQHDACKIYILSGETKYGLTNTGLFTRSHCGCDSQFRECLRKTSSLVSAQIGLTYFNVLGPQCFRKAHPIVRCVRRTRITGQKCEEYELDFTKPKMWQWFDNETF